MAKTQPRAVRCIETGDVYQSSGAAGRAFNIDPSGILKCCKGLANSAAGHTWEFADKDAADEDAVIPVPPLIETALTGFTTSSSIFAAVVAPLFLLWIGNVLVLTYSCKSSNDLFIIILPRAV